MILVNPNGSDTASPRPMTRSAMVYFLALALLFPAFGTRHTFYADRAAAFLKYLRFSREIDWNNFSHTDSSPAAFKRAQPKQKDGGDFSYCLVFLSLYASWAFRKFTAALPGALGWNKLSLLLMNFHENFSSLVIENAKHSFFIYSSSTSDQHFNNTFSFALLPWRGKLRGESTVRATSWTFSHRWRSPILVS